MSPFKPRVHSHKEGMPIFHKHNDDVARQSVARRDVKMTPARKFRSSITWQKLQKMHIRRQPLCVDPFGKHAAVDIAVPAQDVNHVVSLRTNWARRLDPTNLVSLCRRCHNGITAMENKNEDVVHLFAGKTISLDDFIHHDPPGGL